MADRIWIENKDQGIIAEQLAESPKRMARATRLAANTALRRANTAVKRGMASELGIAQKHIKGRIILRPAKTDSSVSTSGDTSARRDAFARLWIGLNRVAARQLYWGRLKQDDQGAWAKKYFFRDSFVAYRKSKKGPSIYKRIGRDRFPIKLQGVEIDKPETRALLDKVAIGAEQKYADEVQRLLRVDWSKVKKGRR